MFARVKSFFNEVFAEKPTVEVQHPGLGTLCRAHDSSLWQGESRRGERVILFFINGSASSPDEKLVEEMRDIIEHFGEHEAAALEFIKDPTGVVGKDKFSFDELGIYRSGSFTMSFTLQGDEGSIWRAEFEKGRPVYSGRDS